MHITTWRTRLVVSHHLNAMMGEYSIAAALLYIYLDHGWLRGQGASSVSWVTHGWLDMNAIQGAHEPGFQSMQLHKLQIPSVIWENSNTLADIRRPPGPFAYFNTVWDARWFCHCDEIQNNEIARFVAWMGKWRELMTTFGPVTYRLRFWKVVTNSVWYLRYNNI